MKSTKGIKRLIKRSHITSSSEVDKRILGDALEAIRGQAEGAELERNIWKTILKSPIAKLAAAAMIIVAIGIFVDHGSVEEAGGPEVAEVAKSPAEMMTMASLTIAYRRGGMDAVEEQCEKACKLLGPRPEKLSIQELLTEFNGT